MDTGRTVKKVYIGKLFLTTEKIVKEGSADQKWDSTDIESHEKKLTFGGGVL
jgi:hypothetical protein